jgi:polyisoprenoid-binding protein YceI
MKKILRQVCLGVLAITIGTSQAQSSDIPSGTYTLDHSHATLLFRVSHLGFSNYTARFKRFDAVVQFDSANIENSQLDVTVDSTSIETDYPHPETVDFNAQLRGPDWLDSADHPQMSFRSTRVVLAGDRAFRINGELTLRGITRPVVLDATYNGGYAGHPLDPHARIGFSARGTIRRSDFGMTVGIPAPGTTMGVGDDVEVIVEAEFSGPPLVQPSG